MKRLLLFTALLSAMLSFSADIIIARGQARKSSPTQKEMDAQANIVTRFFTDARVDTLSIKDTELTPATLRGARLVVLPYNAPLPSPNFNALSAAVDNGCKVIAFYLQDPKVASLLGLQTPKYATKAAFGAPVKLQFGKSSVQGLPHAMPHSTSVGAVLTPTLKNGARILAAFLNAQGNYTGFPAVTANANGFAFAHIFPRSSREDAEQMLLALAATALPGIWEKPTARMLEDTGVIGPARSLDELKTLLGARQPGPHAVKLNEAEHHLAAAHREKNKRNLADAYVQARMARTAARDAYLLSCKSRPGELRGVWLHSAYGIRDWGWDKTIRVLKENGFNAIFANMLWGYVADFPSNVLPTHPDVAKKGDQIKLCLDACRKYGVQLHVWKVCWNMGHRTDEASKKAMRDQGRTQVTFAGKVTDFFAPHLQINQDLETNAFLEIVRKYPVDGIHMDYIRYTDEDADYSPSARAAFEAYINEKVPNWPADCTVGGQLRKRFNAWRRSNISRLVERVSREAHALRPDIKVSAAVYGGWDNSKDSVAQEPELWLKYNWLDFVCPMNYTPDPAYFQELVERQVQSVKATRPLYVGIGSYMIADAPGVAEQIEITRRLGADGFICFSHNLGFATEKLPLLGKTITAGNQHPPYPHQSPSLTTSPAPSAMPLLEDAYALSDTINVALTFPKSAPRPPRYMIRLLKDGHRLQPQPPIKLNLNKNTVNCSFHPTEPGIYRLECSDDKTFISRSDNLTVLSNADVRQKQLEARVPLFKNNGKPRIAVWQHKAYGAANILQILQASGQFDAAPLYNLKDASLATCQAIIIPQPRQRADIFRDPLTYSRLNAYVQNGGALLVTHALVGIRQFSIVCPDVVASAKEPPLKSTQWRPLPRHHTIATFLPIAPQESTFVDMVAMTPGQNGMPFAVENKTNTPVAIAGKSGKGRMVAVGLALGIGSQDKDCTLTPTEQQLVIAAANWMTRKDAND